MGSSPCPEPAIGDSGAEFPARGLALWGRADARGDEGWVLRGGTG